MKIPDIQYINNNIKSFLAIFKNNYPDFYKYIQDNYNGNNISEKLYQYFYGTHKCPICGNPTRFLGFKKGYQIHCSSKCAQNDNCVRDKINITSTKKYGGVGFGSLDLKRKAENTCKSNWGVDNIFKNTEYIQQKFKEKYNGISSPQQLKKTREKTKKTNLERYGVEYPTQNKYIKEKAKNTSRNRHINTINDLIGYTNDRDWICKCPHHDNCNQCVEKFYITNSSIYDNRLSRGYELCTKLAPINSNEIGISHSSQLYFDQLDQYFPDSIYYKKSGYEYRVGKYSLDFYVPSESLCIEYNGVYWHAKPTLYTSNDILNIYGIQKKASDIWNHDKKRKEYIESNGIKVITIWEDDLPDSKRLVGNIKSQI